ncbi:DUF2235 domain-containing protein [Planktotalea arctica]|uniref:DUF2235 domain-containing protein n=1 Tax=Planktotalea arctica TaxID=1481893 RepID=UPI00321B7995
MKRIAIFCDGTWNLSDRKESQTNVVQLAQAVKTTSSDGVKQVPLYIRGVGTGRGSNALARASDKWFGGILGWGLDDNIEDAYRQLIWLYEPGDEIYIFGFSRGAYTARSLAGLLRKAGILRRSEVDRVPEAMRLYRTRGKDGHPDVAAVQSKRAALSPDVATSTNEFIKRANSENPVKLLEISYLGVFDTVGALGLPGFLGMISRLTNQKYSFHDTALSSSVKAAYHAVALDERRKAFPPSLWENLDRLNALAQRQEPAYRQIWFAGDHGSIGGGGDVVGLSAFTHDWIAKGAIAQGLDMDEEMLQRRVQRCRVADVVNNKKQGILGKFAFLLKDREGPRFAAHVHESVLAKILLGARNDGGPYRPDSLAQVWNDLPGLLPPQGPGDGSPPPLDDEDDEITPQPS